MTHGSLFSGIGGFDLAAEWMGWKNVFHCEFDPFCQKVLAHHFPNSKLYDDVRTFDATIYRGRIDVLTGGFPCQPFSAAGKRKGTDDPRHLWPAMLERIKEIQPRYIVGENVRGILNWSDGLVFDQVCADLEAEGYEIAPLLLPACSVNAPHRRDRVWFCAQLQGSVSDSGGDGRSEHHEPQIRCGSEPGGIPLDESLPRSGTRDASDTDGLRLEYAAQVGDVQKRAGKTQGERRESSKPTEANGLGRSTAHTDISTGQRQRVCEPSEGKLDRCDCAGDAPNPDIIGPQRGGDRFDGLRQETQQGQTKVRGSDRTSPDTISLGRNEDVRRANGESNESDQNGAGTNWQNFPTQPPICGGDDGLPSELDGITFPKWRNESIKGYGNAIVPQVALQIFKAIESCDTLRPNKTT